MKRLLFFSALLLSACTKDIKSASDDLGKEQLTSVQKSAAISTVGFALQQFYWAKGAASSSTQTIHVGWEAIGESQLVSYDLESNISGSYVRLVMVNSTGSDALVTHTYVDAIPKNSKNYYYRLVYHYVNGTTSMSNPMYVDLKKKSYHICLKQSCWQ